ncbi:MAG TPA: hypothetical protein VFP58_13130 [Candidatus Eisenbacteria bacterium]|nr:hypothetical protein [Candidatus Eisenbacteria bacterium]
MPWVRGRATALAAPMLLVALLLLGGCDEKDEAADIARLEEMEARIDEMIANRACTAGGSCRIIAFGAKPCGGPWEYKIYSAEHVDTLALQRAVKEYNEFNREANERHGWLSDCSVPMQPNVACYQGNCEVVAP